MEGLQRKKEEGEEKEIRYLFDRVEAGQTCPATDDVGGAASATVGRASSHVRRHSGSIES